MNKIYKTIYSAIPFIMILVFFSSTSALYGQRETLNQESMERDELITDDKINNREVSYTIIIDETSNNYNTSSDNLKQTTAGLVDAGYSTDEIVSILNNSGNTVSEIVVACLSCSIDMVEVHTALINAGFAEAEVELAVPQRDGQVSFLLGINNNDQDTNEWVDYNEAVPQTVVDAVAYAQENGYDVELLGASKVWDGNYYELKVDGKQNAYLFDGEKFTQVSNLGDESPLIIPGKAIEKKLDLDPGLGLKDPDIQKIELPNGETQRVMIITDTNQTVKVYMVNDDGSLGAEININLNIPALSENERIWAPDLVVADGKIYVYYARGENDENGNVDWSSYRIYVAEADINNDVNVDDSLLITGINFSNQQEVDLLNYGEFAGQTDYGIIDAEVFVDGGQVYMYYVVVTPETGERGTENHRPHQEFIRCQKMTNYTTAVGQGDGAGYDAAVYDGWAGSLDDGVAEAPSVFKVGDTYVMLFSSYGSDGNQRIVAIKSDNPTFSNWTDRTVVLSSDPDCNPWQLVDKGWETNGVGGQAISGSQLFYQGLSEESGFQLGVIDIQAFLKDYVQ